MIAKSELEEKESASPVPEPLSMLSCYEIFSNFIMIFLLEGKVLSELPEGCEPIFISNGTQELFNCLTEKDVTLENPYKILKKEDILQDIYNRAAVSDFQPYNKKITDYEGEEILVCYDREYLFGQNFFIAFTEEAKNFILTVNKFF